MAKSLTNGNKFEKGQTDVFDLDLPDLGALRKIRFEADPPIDLK